MIDSILSQLSRWSRLDACVGMLFLLSLVLVGVYGCRRCDSIESSLENMNVVYSQAFQCQIPVPSNTLVSSDTNGYFRAVPSAVSGQRYLSPVLDVYVRDGELPAIKEIAPKGTKYQLFECEGLYGVRYEVSNEQGSSITYYRAAVHRGPKEWWDVRLSLKEGRGPSLANFCSIITALHVGVRGINPEE